MNTPGSGGGGLSINMSRGNGRLLSLRPLYYHYYDYYDYNYGVLL